MIEDFEFSLSARGQKAIGKIMRVDIDLWQEAAGDAFDPEANPTGKIALNVAENVLSWPKLQAKLQAVSRDAPPDWVSSYTSTLGHPSFREILARFLAKHLAHVAIKPDHLAVSAGASSVIETTSFLLAHPGDVATIPAPAYPVYASDLGNISQVERFDIVTHDNIQALTSSHPLTIKHLENTKSNLASQGKNMRMLILTSPDNPTGQIYSEQQMEAFANWCIEHSIHLIVNEIYGLSRFDVKNPAIAHDYSDDLEYCSIAKIMAEKKSPFIHQWYAFSKDFGISGFRVGVLHSHNEALIKAYENYNLTRCVSNHTQWLLQETLSDDAFVEDYIRYNQSEITTSYALTVNMLKKMGVPYSAARGSLFVWANFAQYLNAQTADAENALWLDIYNNTGVLLTPGLGFGHQGHGFYRIVFSAVPRSHLEEALLRLERYLASR